MVSALMHFLVPAAELRVYHHHPLLEVQPSIHRRSESNYHHLVEVPLDSLVELQVVQVEKP